MSIDGSASAWLRHEQARFDGEISKASSAAIRLAALAGVDFVVACAKSPFEERDEPFLKLARTNDLSVVDAADAGNPVQRRLAEDILFESGRPVLVVPAVGSADLPRRIAIAWDGSAGAARAVGDALPFLRLADTVVAVTVTGEKDLSHMALGADLASYLAAHGVPHCKLANLSARSSDVGARLRLFVAEEDIDWIVMGAFVHSRFRQAILGGVTRSMLDEVSVPLFMSH